MDTEKKSVNEISWTWADQISSYRFWGILLFYLFLLIPNSLINYSYQIFNISTADIADAFTIKSFAAFGGFWLAWFMVRLKNHFLLYLFSAFTILAWLLMYFIPSIVSISIGFFLSGLAFGAISLAIPAIISGGRGGSEMFVVSFGLISFFELSTWASSPKLFHWVFENQSIHGYKISFLIALISAVIGTILLLPVKATLFNSTPPKREFSLTPKFRDPLAVALLCLIPIFSIYYIIYLSYRYHGEVNRINPTQNILSPRAAAWCMILLPILIPIITSSLNSSLTSKISKDGKFKFYKNWTIILWSFLFTPISFALIQSNMNKLINNRDN